MRLFITALLLAACALPASAQDITQQSPTTFSGQDFSRTDGVIGTKASAQRTVAGLSDTLLAGDGTIHWTGRVTAARTQTLPGCPAGIDTRPRTIVDDVGLAGLYPITITPVAGTIAGNATYALNWPFGAVELRCDGVGNYAVTATTRPAPPPISLSERTLPDANSFLTVWNRGLGNQPQQISIENLLGTEDGRLHNTYSSACSATAPCLVTAEAASAFNIGSGGGSIYLNLQGLSFYKPYMFTADGTSTIYLDPGKDGLFQGWGLAGQMLKVNPGDTVVIFRRTGGLYHVLASASAGSVPGAMPTVAVSTVGDYDIPADAGGKLHLTNAATNFTIQNSAIGVEYCVGNKSGGAGTIQPNAGQVLLPQGSTGRKITVPTSGTVCFVRWTAGIWIITRWVGTSVLESVVNIGSAVPLTVAGTAYDVTFIDLPPGRWTITGGVVFNPASGTSTTVVSGWASTTSATAPSKPNNGGLFDLRESWAGSGNVQASIGSMKLATTTDPLTRVYLSARSTFTGSTTSAYGYISATQY